MRVDHLSRLSRSGDVLCGLPIQWRDGTRTTHRHWRSADAMARGRWGECAHARSCGCTPSRWARTCGSRSWRRCPRAGGWSRPTWLASAGRQTTTGRPSIDDFAHDLDDLAHHLGLRHFVLGGLSMGGYAVFAYLRLNPSRVKGIVLADTKSGADTPQAHERPAEDAGPGGVQGRRRRRRRDGAQAAGRDDPASRSDAGARRCAR